MSRRRRNDGRGGEKESRKVRQRARARKAKAKSKGKGAGKGKSKGKGEGKSTGKGKGRGGRRKEPSSSPTEESVEVFSSVDVIPYPRRPRRAADEPPGTGRGWCVKRMGGRQRGDGVSLAIAAMLVTAFVFTVGGMMTLGWFVVDAADHTTRAGLLRVCTQIQAGHTDCRALESDDGRLYRAGAAAFTFCLLSLPLALVAPWWSVAMGWAWLHRRPAPQHRRSRLLGCVAWTVPPLPWRFTALASLVGAHSFSLAIALMAYGFTVYTSDEFRDEKNTSTSYSYVMVFVAWMLSSIAGLLLLRRTSFCCCCSCCSCCPSSLASASTSASASGYADDSDEYSRYTHVPMADDSGDYDYDEYSQ